MKTATLKTYEEIIAEEKANREAFEAKETFRGFTVADLRKTMNAVENPQGWKKPWAAAVHHSLVGIVLAAVEFFHADAAKVVGIEALTGRVLMEGRGYQG